MYQLGEGLGAMEVQVGVIQDFENLCANSAPISSKGACREITKQPHAHVMRVGSFRQQTVSQLEGSEI